MRDVLQLSRDRVWFEDDRVPPRRLQVTHHPERRVVVLSVWHEGTCTATFQLPIAEAPALIDVLVTALAAAVRPVVDSAGAPPPRPTARDRLRSWATALVRRSA